MMSRMQTVGVQRNGVWDWTGMEMFPWCPMDVTKHEALYEEVYCIETADGTYEWDADGGACLIKNGVTLKYWPAKPNMCDLTNGHNQGIYVRYFRNGETFMRWDDKEYYWSVDIPCHTRVYTDNDYCRYWQSA